MGNNTKKKRARLRKANKEQNRIKRKKEVISAVMDIPVTVMVSRFMKKEHKKT